MRKFVASLVAVLSIGAAVVLQSSIAQAAIGCGAAPAGGVSCAGGGDTGGFGWTWDGTFTFDLPVSATYPIPVITWW